MTSDPVPLLGPPTSLLAEMKSACGAEVGSLKRTPEWPGEGGGVREAGRGRGQRSDRWLQLCREQGCYCDGSDCYREWIQPVTQGAARQCESCCLHLPHPPCHPQLVCACVCVHALGVKAISWWSHYCVSLSVWGGWGWGGTGGMGRN